MVKTKIVLSVCICCVVVCYASDLERQKRASQKQIEDISAYQTGHRIAKRGTYPFWIRHRPSVWKRFNHINSIPDATIDETEQSNDIGNILMDDFMMFLTLKDAGLLDMCLGVKKR